MSKHHNNFNPMSAAKKMFQKEAPPKPPRPAKEIEQEYANLASTLGDTYFAQELQKAKIKQLTMKLSELKDEHALAKSLETQPEAPKAVTPEVV